jgi:hypothetical protein
MHIKWLEAAIQADIDSEAISDSEAIKLLGELRALDAKCSNLREETIPPAKAAPKK